MRLLNDLDCKIILNQKNPKWYIDSILKTDFHYGKPLYDYIIYNRLYDKAGIGDKNELVLYEPNMGLISFREYLIDDENQKNPRLKKMFDMFMDITMSGEITRLVRVIMAFADIKKEIPEYVLKKYLSKANDYNIRMLCSSLIPIMIPPVELLERLIKNRGEYAALVSGLNTVVTTNYYNPQWKANAKTTWGILNRLIKKDFVKTESFKSFFNR
jgi:hypothetical protein